MEKVVRLQLQGHGADAVPLWQQLVAREPSCPQWRAALVSLLLRLERTEEAAAVLADPAAAEPALPLLLARAACAQRQGDRRVAAKHYRQVLELDPEHLGARAALRLLDAPQPEADEHTGLESDLQRALDAHDLEAALELSRRLRSLPDAPPWTLLRHAHLLRQLGRPQEALEALQTSVDAPSLQAHVLKNRGEIQRELGDLSASLASLQEAVALDPSCPDHAILLEGEVVWFFWTGPIVNLRRGTAPEGALTVGEAFSEGFEQAPNPQPRVQGQGRHAGDHWPQDDPGDSR